MDKENKIEQININPEQASSVEQTPEKSLDSNKIEQSGDQIVQEKADSDSMAASQVVIPDVKDEKNVLMSNEVIHKQVEDVLSENMDKVFLSLDAGAQREFKIKGEEISNKITELLLQTKTKVEEITKLILEWLRIIPKVNKYYLEQEAKIKTDKILKINKNK